jgi:hypothetical protein
MKTFARAFLVLSFGVLPSPLIAQTDAARSAEDTVITSKGVFLSPVGFRRPDADTTAHSRKEYHGLRWTLIGAGVGAVLGGGATAYVASICATGGDCRGVWRWIVMGAGAGAIVVGFLTGLVYGLFNG